MTQSDLDEASPLRPVVFAVLVALSQQPMHGYGIMKAVNERLVRGGLLGPGTLYRTLKELREDGWVEYTEGPPDADSRRRYYRLTPSGLAVARTEASRMAAWVDAARSSRLLAE